MKGFQEFMRWGMFLGCGIAVPFLFTTTYPISEMEQMWKIAFYIFFLFWILVVDIVAEPYLKDWVEYTNAKLLRVFFTKGALFYILGIYFYGLLAAEIIPAFFMPIKPHHMYNREVCPHSKR